jgi:hypothetical protein
VERETIEGKLGIDRYFFLDFSAPFEARLVYRCLSIVAEAWKLLDLASDFRIDNKTRVEVCQNRFVFPTKIDPNIAE